MTKPTPIEVEKLLKTLPTSYYFGTRINYSLSTTAETSFINLETRTITISYNNIVVTDKMDLEQQLRCCLYHEVMHAILTPPDLFCDRILNDFERYYKSIGLTKNVIKDIINIFEDERGETLLRTTFLNTDFKKFVYTMNGFDPSVVTEEHVKDPISLFYMVVRFRNVGKFTSAYKKFIDEVNTIIEGKKYVSFITDFCYVYRYVQVVLDFYARVTKGLSLPPTIEKPKIPTHGSEGSKPVGPLVEGGDDPDSEPAGEPTDIPSDIPITTINLPEILESTLVQIDMYRQKIESLFNRQVDATKNKFAVYGYSGSVLDERRIGKPYDDYKWYKKFTDDNGYGIGTRQIKFNLFIDVSGSFSPHKLEVNNLITALLILEKEHSEFKFDVIKMGMNVERGKHNIVAEKNERYIDPTGGNKLDDSIFDCYRKVQTINATNINIVLFDGDAQSDCPTNGRPWTVWNNYNSIIVSDPENRDMIKTYAPKCKYKITRDYVKAFSDFIISELNRLLL